MGGKYGKTSEMRKDTNHKDSDIARDPEVLIERYIYEERLQMEDRGEVFLFLSTKTCII